MAPANIDKDCGCAMAIAWFLGKELKYPRISTDATAEMESVFRFVPLREGATVLYVAQT